MERTAHEINVSLKSIDKSIKSVAKSLSILANESEIRMKAPIVIKDIHLKERIDVLKRLERLEKNENELPDYLKVDSDLLDSLSIRGNESLSIRGNKS